MAWYFWPEVILDGVLISQYYILFVIFFIIIEWCDVTYWMVSDCFAKMNNDNELL